MDRPLLLAVLCALSLACPTPPLELDSGPEPEDAGMDAGRPGRTRGIDPPTGWSQVVLAADSGLGVGAVAVGDEFDQPLVAYLEDDPNNDGVRVDTRLLFTRWNGAPDGGSPGFQAPRQVEVALDTDITPPNRPVALHRDATTGLISLAYVRGPAGLRFVYSDDEGESFSTTAVTPAPSSPLAGNPAVAVRGQVAHLAYWQGDAPRGAGTVTYLTRTGLSGPWTATVAPSAAGFSQGNGPISLALDSEGKVGVAYTAVSGVGAAVLFWRPGTAPVVVDSTTEQLTAVGDEPSVTLRFVGTIPHLAYHLRRDPRPNPMDFRAGDVTELWYRAGLDAAGQSWGTAVAAPRNSANTGMVLANSTAWYQGLVVFDTTAAQVAAYYRTGLVPGLSCGGPKLFLRAAGGNTQTCHPGGNPQGTGAPAAYTQDSGRYVSLFAHAPNKSTLVMQATNRSPPLERGIVMWRQP